MPQSPSPAIPLGRQPALDGIRGIAILSVLAFHFHWSGLPGGYLGVDIFFTLSGFLITTLLMEEHFAHGRISLGRFFARRCLRLYPALVALVAVSSLYSLCFHPETAAKRVGLIAASVLGYAANWATMIDSSGWFGGMPHTWSLAIEAQFYVLWALTLALVTRQFLPQSGSRHLLQVLTLIALVVVVASMGWREYLSMHGSPWLRTYLGTDTRLDAVFIGSVAALVRLQYPLLAAAIARQPAGRLLIWTIEAACAVLIVVLLTTLLWRKGLPGRLGFTFASIATAVLILTATQWKASLLGFMLRNSTLTWLGRISYSLYIWHVPAEKFVSSARLKSAGLSPLGAEVVRLGITLLIGVLSYHFIERTFLRLKHRLEPAIPVPVPVAVPVVQHPPVVRDTADKL